MRNVKLVIAYDGTDFHGFAAQKGQRTVSGVLEDVLSGLARGKLKITGAGRTDAGVHASGQVVNFDAEAWPCPVERMPLALNALLPPDLAVVSASRVPDEFHARYGAKHKTYVYTVCNQTGRSPLRSRYSWHVSRPLDLGDMREAVALLTGVHDFAAFRVAGTFVSSTVRHLFLAEVVSDPPLIRMSFCADGFLYKMVRMMVGTLVEVGRGKLSPGAVAGLLREGNGGRGGPAAPPQGLCLDTVCY